MASFVLESGRETFKLEINGISDSKNIFRIQGLLQSLEHSLMVWVDHSVGEWFPDLSDTVVVGDAPAVFKDFFTSFLFDIVIDGQWVRNTLEIKAEINVNSSSLKFSKK